MSPWNVARILFHLNNLQHEWAILRPVIEGAAKLVLIPFLMGTFGTLAVLKVLQSLYRLLFPPNAKELHKEALRHLSKGENGPTIYLVKRLLSRSIQRDPYYLPPRLTLAAFQLYRDVNAKEAKATIQDALVLFPGNKELKQMELDADAVQAGMANMVLAGSAATDYLGDYTYRYR